MVSQDEKQDTSQWNTVKSYIRSGELVTIGNKNSNCEKCKNEKHNEKVDSDKLKHVTSQNETEVPVEHFVTEVVSRVNSIKKIKGIIKSGFCCDHKNEHKSKNRVHFSEENITIVIPRPPVSNAQIVQDILCYFCCFGWLFPGV